MHVDGEYGELHLGSILNTHPVPHHACADTAQSSGVLAHFT